MGLSMNAIQIFESSVVLGPIPLNLSESVDAQCSEEVERIHC